MQTTQKSESAVAYFTSELERKKQLIDARIESYTASFEAQTAELYGDFPLATAATFSDYLKRGGKRIRGALTMVGYELAGGSDQDMILDAALAVEMLQSYILMMDDIQDRSDTRRGGPTAHMMMKQYHEQHHFKDDSLHFGESMAMNAFVIGCHSAIDVLLGLNTNSDRIIRAIHNVNRCYVTTGHGQTMDVFNEVSGMVGEESVESVLIWKTAYYTFVNPLQLGAILAGANEKQLDVLYRYSLPAGRAFQITDDILGIYGDEFESGKSPLDDIKEGKRTILTLKALEMSPKADAYYLETCLGKHDLSMPEFQRCKEIIKNSGALNYAQRVAEDAVEDAILMLHTAPSKWNASNILFLEGLVRYLLHRKS